MPQLSTHGEVAGFLVKTPNSGSFCVNDCWCRLSVGPAVTDYYDLVSLVAVNSSGDEVRKTDLRACWHRMDKVEDDEASKPLAAFHVVFQLPCPLGAAPSLAAAGWIGSWQSAS